MNVGSVPVWCKNNWWNLYHEIIPSFSCAVKVNDFNHTLCALSHIHTTYKGLTLSHSVRRLWNEFCMEWRWVWETWICTPHLFTRESQQASGFRQSLVGFRVGPLKRKLWNFDWSLESITDLSTPSQALKPLSTHMTEGRNQMTE